MSDSETPAPVGYWEYGWEKCKRQPLVPLGKLVLSNGLTKFTPELTLRDILEILNLIGVLATCGALLGATSSLRKGNREQFNKYLRFRVA